jgi:uncharacterized protein YndB with AHSA1/START domain
MGRAYRFRTTWLLPAPAPAVFGAVTDLAEYPSWWPDVHAVSRVDDDTAELVCRAALPYRLVLRMRRAVQDEPSGRLRVMLSGDLEGFLAGQLTGSDEHSRLVITQEVVVRKPLLRSLDLVARPVFRANHAWMMRRGLRGLRAYLAAPAA